jgi:hypothetical protein
MQGGEQNLNTKCAVVHEETAFQYIIGCIRSTELRNVCNFYTLQDINDGIILQTLEETQSNVVNNDDSKPSSKCRISAQF